MKRFTTLSLIVAAGLAAGTAGADIVWTGAVDSDINNAANYDFSGSTEIDLTGFQGGVGFVGVADNFVYGAVGNAPEMPNAAGQVRHGSPTGGGFTMTFDGVTSPTAGGSNDGWSSNFVNVINGSSVNAFFFINSTVSIDGTSVVTLGGGGNPVNVTSIDLAPGAVVNLTAETVAAFNAEHLGSFTVNGAALVDGVNATVASDGGSGSIITAIVPEPGSLALLGLGGLALIRRRRA